MRMKYSTCSLHKVRKGLVVKKGRGGGNEGMMQNNEKCYLEDRKHVQMLKVK